MAIVLIKMMLNNQIPNIFRSLINICLCKMWLSVNNKHVYVYVNLFPYLWKYFQYNYNDSSFQTSGWFSLDVIPKRHYSAWFNTNLVQNTAAVRVVYRPSLETGYDQTMDSISPSVCLCPGTPLGAENTSLVL